MKISILLPYKENFSPDYPGAVSLFVYETSKISRYKKNIVIFGSTDFKEKFKLKYINIRSRKNPFESQTKHYVNEFIKLQNQAYGSKNLIPSIEFEKSWAKIEKENPSNLLYLKAPSQFAYFMNRGLILKTKLNNSLRKEYQGLCFELDPNQKILKKRC